MIPNKNGSVQVISLDNHEHFFADATLKISVHPSGGHLFVSEAGEEFVRPGAKGKAVLGQGCTTGDQMLIETVQYPAVEAYDMGMKLTFTPKYPVGEDGAVHCINDKGEKTKIGDNAKEVRWHGN